MTIPPRDFSRRDCRRRSAPIAAILGAALATVPAACSSNDAVATVASSITHDSGAGSVNDAKGGGDARSLLQADAGHLLALDGGCATATASTKRSPLYLLFVLDASDSMNDDNKWTAVVGAFDSIFDALLQANDPSTGVGLIIYGGANDPTCHGVCLGPYPTPEDVSVAAVDQTQHDRLRKELDSDSPAKNTPTSLALKGAYSELSSFTAQSPLLPDGKKVVVLITDGVPTDGSTTASNKTLVANAYAETPPQGPITTFAMGVGPFPSPDTVANYNPAFLGNVAEAGGTAPAGCNPNELTNVADVCYFQITPQGTSAQQLTQEFITTIDQIRGEAASCVYELEKSGAPLDPSEVNVVYTDGSGVQHVLTQNATNGWTYDNPTNPTEVILHGTDCSTVKADPDGKVWNRHRVPDHLQVTRSPLSRPGCALRDPAGATTAKGSDDARAVRWCRDSDLESLGVTADVRRIVQAATLLR